MSADKEDEIWDFNFVPTHAWFADRVDLRALIRNNYPGKGIASRLLTEHTARVSDGVIVYKPPNHSPEKAARAAMTCSEPPGVH